MITREEIENIALLSKLYVAEDEIERVSFDLERMMEFADSAAKAEADEEKSSGEGKATPFMRADAVGDSLPAEDVFANVTDSAQGYFSVRNG